MIDKLLVILIFFLLLLNLIGIFILNLKLMNIRVSSLIFILHYLFKTYYHNVFCFYTYYNKESDTDPEFFKLLFVAFPNTEY